MIRTLGTVLAGALGLAFGSFLNVVVSRWPAGESVVSPRSHCRQCERTLAWWENVPLVSWLALRGRCRSCRAWIGWRYPLVEAAVGGLWSVTAWQTLRATALDPFLDNHTLSVAIYIAIAIGVGNLILYWLLVALAVLDAEHFWLPDWLTLSGIGAGFIFVLLRKIMIGESGSLKSLAERSALTSIAGIVAAAALILLIRWGYWLIRHREGMGLGDVKLMAMLAAWLGFPGALLAFALGAVIGSLFAVFLLAVPSRRNDSNWAASKIPFGSFLSVGGIISSLWGQPIIAAYLHWAGF